MRFQKKIQPKVAKKLRFDLIFREAATAEIKKNKNMFNVLWANPRTILRYGQNTSHNLILWVIIMCTLGVGPYQDLSIEETQMFLIGWFFICSKIGIFWQIADFDLLR